MLTGCCGRTADAAAALERGVAAKLVALVAALNAGFLEYAEVKIVIVALIENAGRVGLRHDIGAMAGGVRHCGGGSGDGGNDDARALATAAAAN